MDEEIREAAARVYKAVGAEGLARVDFILAESGELCCLEINTLPGMTPLSLSPMAAKAAGVEFDELVAMILDAAVRRDQS